MFLVWIEFRKDGDELKELELIVIILIGYDFAWNFPCYLSNNKFFSKFLEPERESGQFFNVIQIIFWSTKNIYRKKI